MKIGWIGFGVMGIFMVICLCDVNLEVFVYNWIESKVIFLKEKGVVVYINFIDLAVKVDLIFIMFLDKMVIDVVLVLKFWE